MTRFLLSEPWKILVSVQLLRDVNSNLSSFDLSFLMDQCKYL